MYKLKKLTLIYVSTQGDSRGREVILHDYKQETFKFASYKIKHNFQTFNYNTFSKIYLLNSEHFSTSTSLKGYTLKKIHINRIFARFFQSGLAYSFPLTLISLSRLGYVVSFFVLMLD